VLGLPFLLAWIVAWVIMTSIIMAMIYKLDRARDVEGEAVATAVNITDHQT
jgi:hypothetical protein